MTDKDKSIKNNKVNMGEELVEKIKELSDLVNSIQEKALLLTSPKINSDKTLPDDIAILLNDTNKE